MARAKKKTTVTENYSQPMFFLGLFLMGCGLFVALSLLTADIFVNQGDAAQDCLTGLLGVWAAYGLRLSIGLGASIFLCALFLMWGLLVMRREAFWNTWPEVLGGVVMIACLALLLPVLSGTEFYAAGGLLAHKAGPAALLYFGHVGLVLVCSLILFIGAYFCFGARIIFLVAALLRVSGRLLHGCKDVATNSAILLKEQATPKLLPLLTAATTTAERAQASVTDKRTADTKPEADAPIHMEASSVLEPIEVAAAVIDETLPPPPPISAELDEDDLDEMVSFAEDEFTPYGEEQEEPPAPISIKKAEPRTAPAAPAPLSAPQEEGDYQLPPLHLLQEPEESQGEATNNLERRARILEQTLQEFKIDGRVVHIECGPRVTMFEMTLAPGIRLSKVMSLADNISMALKAANVRIIAPIPGKDTIGIEIPNVEKDLVALREIVEAVNREKRKQALPICLAKDVSGEPIVADLAKMPHLLIAGATGSGKSVCINSIILSILMCCKPEEAKLIMVDPKVVELSRFRDIPHLLSPVITDMKKTVGVLEWACNVMDERYEQLSMVGVNNISKFNALGEEKIADHLKEMYTEDELELFPKSLPYIVIIIDELADLMMVAGKEVEVHITRLAAKSRAVGIHVILATQRPSVDVITGLIKANMPSRIAFQVASRVDSRTILDQNGAETLLGAGDMLFLPPGVGKLTRAQGVFVSDEELAAVVDFAKAQRKPRYHTDLEGPVIGGAKGSNSLDDYDDLFCEAVGEVLQSGRGSVSLLQRKLGIGYGRASRIIDQMADAAVLGPFREGKAREILMTEEEFTAKFAPGGGKAKSAPPPPVAGVRDDERPPEDLPWDELE